MVTPTRVGGPSESPLTLIAPPTAWATKSSDLYDAQGPPGSVAAYRGDDQLRLLAQQLVDRQAEALERVGREVLRQHVGAAHERAQAGAIRVGAEVEHDAALALIEQHEDDAVALVVAADQMPAGLAAGRLDLDDVGAEPGEDLCRRRSGFVLREIDDADSLERSRFGHVIHHAGSGGNVKAVRSLGVGIGIAIGIDHFTQ
jgi:hypothetical protein